MNYKQKNELFKNFQTKKRALLESLNAKIYKLKAKQLEDDFNALVKLEARVTALVAKLNYNQAKKNKPTTTKIKDARSKHNAAKKNRATKVRLAIKDLKAKNKEENKKLREDFRAALKK